MGNQIDIIGELASNLIVQEYISLKAEIRDLVDETGRLPQYSIVFTAVFVGFLLKNRSLKIPKSFNFLPAICTALLALRSTIIGIHIGRIGEYIRNRIEPQFNHLDQFKEMGWEAFYKTDRIFGINMSILGISFTVFWTLNLIGCIIIGCWLSKYQENKKNDIPENKV